MPDKISKDVICRRACDKHWDSLHAATNPIARKRMMLAGLCRLTRAEHGALVVTSSSRRATQRRLISAVTWQTGAAGEFRNSLLLQGSPATPMGSNRNFAALHGLGPEPCGNGYEAFLAWLSNERLTTPCVMCSSRLSGAPGVATIYLFRPRRRSQPFTARHRFLVDLFHKNTCWLYEPDLVLLSSDAHDITPREHQTLELLLNGLSEKQIAGRLGLSHNTVHHYVKALHRHFGVSSRSELLARWVGKRQ